MTAKRSAKAPHRASVQSARSDIVRQLIAAALLRSISVQGATNAAAAKWIGISPRTMHSWVHCARPVNVEAVLACPQLAEAFRVELCIHDHGVGSRAYVAKKTRRGLK